MNRDAERKLATLAKHIPKSIRSGLTHTINKFAEQRSRAEQILSTGRSHGRIVSKEEQKEVARLLQKGAFDHHEEVIDKKVEERMSRELDGMIQAKIRSGELPDPKVVVRNDPFFRERMAIHEEIRKRHS